MFIDLLNTNFLCLNFSSNPIFKAAGWSINYRIDIITALNIIIIIVIILVVLRDNVACVVLSCSIFSHTCGHIAFGDEAVVRNSLIP